MFNGKRLTRKERFLKSKSVKVERMLKSFYETWDYETAASDCMADIMHLAHQEGWDFSEALSKARLHFNAEIKDGEHG